jgi:hypothetical protein
MKFAGTPWPRCKPSTGLTRSAVPAKHQGFNHVAFAQTAEQQSGGEKVAVKVSFIGLAQFAPVWM